MCTKVRSSCKNCVKIKSKMETESDRLDLLLSVATAELETINSENSKTQRTLELTESLIHEGETDSSEDESKRNFETKYNECGKEIKELLKEKTENKLHFLERKTETKNKPQYSSKTVTPSSTLQSTSAVKYDVYYDPIFGIRIVNPLISSAVLKSRMIGRDAITFSKLPSFFQNKSPGQDWVLGAVIVNISSVKTSQNGKKFVIWTLSDLKDDIKTVTMFLFGSAYSDLWKTVVGTVVGILNPNVLDKRTGSKDLVCRKFNELGGKLLTRGFYQLEKRHGIIYKRVKSALPRRESERRVHPLSGHCDILQAIETRISMLNMTYVKYIEAKILCFIPGKVLDEMRWVLALVESDQVLPRTHQLLQELRDLSSMAMEHFDEQILPRIKEKFEKRSSNNEQTASIIMAKNFKPNVSNELYRIKLQCKSYKKDIKMLTQKMYKLCHKLGMQNIRLRAQSRKIKEQERKIHEQTVKMQEQDSALTEIKKHLNECHQRYTDITNEVSRARDDILAATSKNNLNITPPRMFRSNIKPRVTHILPKNYTSTHLDDERKRKSNILPEIPLKRNKYPDEIKGTADEQLVLPSYNSEKTTKLGESALFTNNEFSTITKELLKNPLIKVIPRKRKMLEDLDLN